MPLSYFTPVAAVGMLAAVFFAGAVAASFINCMQIRLQKGEGIWGRSHCPGCGHTLSPLELVPVFSWLALRGRCRHCGERISVRYFLTEVIFGAMYAGILLRFGLGWAALEYTVLFTVLAAECLWDMATFEVPDVLHLLAAANFLLFLGTHPAPLVRLRDGFFTSLGFGAAILVTVLIADRLLHKDTMGGADIKFIAVIGLYLNWAQMLLMLIVGCLVGIGVSLGYKAGWKKAFPFIPSLSVAVYFCVLAADPIIQWYLGLLEPALH